MGDLANKIRSKYPGAYDDTPDAELEAKIVAKYPGAYDHMLSGGTSGANTPNQTALPTTDPNKKTVGADALTGIMQIPQAGNVQAQNIGASAWQWLGENLDVIRRPMAEEAKRLDPSYQVEDNAITQYGKQQVEATNNQMRALDSNLAKDGWGRLIQGAGVSTVQNLANMGAAVLAAPVTGGASAIPLVQNMTLGMMGAQSGLQGYADSRAKGFDVTQSNIRGAGSGGLEVATEKAPLGKFMDIVSPGAQLGMKSLMKKIGEYGLQDIGGELINTLVGDLIYDKASGKPDMTDAEAVQAISEYFESGEAANNAKDTFWQTVIQSAMMGGIGAGANRLTRNKRQQQPIDPSATPVGSTTDREAALAEQRRAIPVGPDTDILNPASQAPYTGPIEDAEAATQLDRLDTALNLNRRENVSGLGDTIPGPSVVAVSADHDMLGGATPTQAIPSRASAPVQPVSSLIADRRNLHSQQEAPIALGVNDMLTPPTAIPATADMYKLPDTQFGAIPTGYEDVAGKDGMGGFSPITKAQPAAVPSAQTVTPPVEVAPGVAKYRTLNEYGEVTDGIGIKPKEQFSTSSGRATTPFPRQKGEKYATQWLIDNAVAEAEARGDGFNAGIFKNEKPLKRGDLPPASKDSMTMYLFGQQPEVVPSILKPLTPIQPTGVPEVQAASSNQTLTKAPEEAKPVVPNNYATGGVKTEFDIERQPDTFMLKTKGETFVSGYIRNQDFPGEKAKPDRGEIFLTHVDESERRNGTGQSITEDAIRLLQANGAKTVNISATSAGGKRIVEKLIANGFISAPIKVSATGKGEHTILFQPTGVPEVQVASAPSEVTQPQTPMRPANTGTKYELPSGWTKDEGGTEYKNKQKDRATRKKDGTWNVHDALGGTPDNVPTLDAALEALAINEDVTLKERKDVSPPKAKESGSASAADKTGVSSGKPEGITTISNISNEVAAISKAVTEYWRGLGFGKMDIATIKGQVKGWYGLGKKATLEGAAGKTIDDAIEMAIVNKAREIAADQTLDVDAKYNAIKALYDNQPNLSARDSQSVTNQAYSTPAPISFTMQEYLGAFADDSLSAYEPTAGTGMLVFGFNPENVDVNELGDIRVQALESQGFNRVTQENGTNNASENGLTDSYDRVVANPPFGKADTVTVDGFPLNKLEHQIVADALSAMNEDGKAAFIIGGHNFHDVMTGKERDKMLEGDRVFFNWLYSNYNVEHNIDVDGSTYGKQGTTWGIRVITVNGRKQEGAPKTYAPKKGDAAYQRANTVDELRAILQGEAANGTQSDERTAGDMPGVSGDRTESTAGDTRPDGDSTGRTGNEPAKSSEGTDTGKSEEVAGDVGSGRTVGTDDADTQGRPGSEPSGTDKRLKPEYEGFDSVALQAIIDVLGEDAVYDMVTEPAIQDMKASQKRTKDAIQQAKKTVKEAQKTAESSPATRPERTAAEQVADVFADFSLTEDDAESRWKKALPAVQKALDETLAKANMATAKIDDLVRSFVTDFVTQVKTALEKIGRTAQDIARAVGAIAPRLNKFVTESRSSIQDKINEAQKPKEPRKTNEHQTPYEPVSKGPSGYTLVPKNTAQDLRDALLNIQTEHGGDLDTYIMKELQYGSMAELHEAFAAEQIDALAMALHNMDKGKGMIIGDMTGIGKGRVVAGIMRYAILNNKVPVFVTEKPKLYSDMWRDVMDTGSSDMVKPLLMASDNEGDLTVVNPDGVTTSVVHKVMTRAKNNQAYTNIGGSGQSGMTGLGYNSIFTTYDQMKGEVSRNRRNVLRAVAPDSIIILDESHNAGGEDSSSNAKMTTGQFFRSDDILGATQGVVYSSATFAKRPDNMPLYFRTAMGDSGMSPVQITNAMERGGVALQQFVSNLLTKAGAMIRREQDFSKIAMFERKVLTESKADAYAKSDSVTVNVRDMMEFAGMMRDNIDWVQIAVDDGHAAEAMQDGAEVGGTEFSSGVWNLINQMQLSMKAEGVVQEALKAIQEGRSPVIGLMNTMESFLNDFAEQNGLSRGDVADFSFNDVLSKMLRNGLRYTIKDPAGKRTHHYMTLEKLEEVSPDLFNMYHAINDALYELDLEGMPASPIDYIKSRLAKEGYNTREITGRNMVITEDENGVPVLANRTDKDRNDSVNGFNSGEVAVLILNKAGSTGLSLHPTNKTANKKPRRMILAQADLDINVVVQMLGRIFRKGQIQDPEYVMLSTALPSETRPSIVLEKKLQSLNANTTSNDKSGYSSEIPDMINKYGDRVFREWIARNADMATLLNIDLGNLDSDAPVAAGDTFKKFSGRMGLMAAAEQERFWAETVEEYKSLIAELDALGMNDLVAKDLDMKAITKTKLTIHQGTNEDNPFMSSAIMEEVSVLMPGKPYTQEQVQEKIDEYLDGMDTKDRGKAMVAQAIEISAAYEAKQREVIDRIDASEPELDDNGDIKDMKVRRERATAVKNMEQVQASFSAFRDMMRSVGIGQVYDLTMGDGETLTAVPYAVKIEKSTAGNPLAGSKIKISYAVPNGTKHITVGMNRESVWSDAAINSRLEFADDWSDMIAGSSMRKTRHIVTGNMLQAFDLIKTRAQMVNFTREDGTMDQGILLPAGANIDQLTAFETATPERAADYLANTYNPSVRDSGNDITLFVTRGRVTINMPASQVKGAKFFTDSALQSLTGVMAKRSGKMAATFDIGMALPVLQRLHELGSRFQIPRQSQAQPAFSNATTDVGTGVSMKNLEDAKATMQQMFPGVKIVIHDSPADVSWATPTARGAYYKGEVHLFRSNIKDSSQAALTVLAHEFTHNGIDKMGAKGKQLLNQIAVAHSDEVKKIMSIRGWKDTTENRVRAANELVAQHGETKLKPNWWNKVKEFLQAAISKITGKPAKLSLIDEAIREIRSQAAPVQKTGSMSLQPAFSENNPSNQNIKDDTVNSKEGSQYEDLSRPDPTDAAAHGRRSRDVRASIERGGEINAASGPATNEQAASRIRQWARSVARLLDHTAFSNAWAKQEKLEGAEQQVILVKKDGKKIAVKRKQMGFGETWLTYLDRLDYHNDTFPDTAYTLEAFSDVPTARGGNTFMAVVRQPFIERKVALDENGKPKMSKEGKPVYVDATTAQIRAYMEYKGFKSFMDPNMAKMGYGEDKFHFLKWIKGDIVVSDLHAGNVWLDLNGKIRIFDPIISKATAQDILAAAEQDELDSAISIPLGDGTFYSQTTDDAASMARKAYDWSLDLAKEFLQSPAKALGPAYRGLRYLTGGAIDIHNMEARELLNRLTPLRKDGPQQKVVYDFLTTVDADPMSITNPDVRAAAKEAKDKIMAIGRELVSMGLMKEDTLAKRDGSYLPRLYMYHLLGTEEASRIEMLSGGKSLDFGFLKERNELLSEEVRTHVLHEIKDPAYLVFMALSRSQSDMAKHSWLEAIAANPDWAQAKQLIDWNMSETPTHVIGNDIQYTINEDGTYNIDQRIVKHERIAHQNVDIDFIKQGLGPNNASYIIKNATGSWQTIGQIKFRMNTKGGFDLSVGVKRTTDVTHTGVASDQLDGIVGDKRADWMRTGRITHPNGKTSPVKTKGGKQVTAFWLASEAKRLQRVLHHDQGMDSADRAKSQRIIDRMMKMANDTAIALGYPMDEHGNAIPKMPDGWKQIPQSKRYGRLSGLVVRKEVYQDIVGKIGRDRDQMTAVETFFSPDADGTLMQLHRIWKKSKTTYNVPTHITNFTSNAVMTHIFTDMSLKDVAQYTRMSVKSILDKDRYWDIAVRHGITSAGFANNELGRANIELVEYMASQEIANASPLEQVTHLAKVLKAKATKIDQSAGDLYQLSETIFKLAIIRHQMEKHGMPAKQAALIAHDTLFDYGDVGPALRFLRQSYLGAPFATFMVKSSELVIRKFIEDTTKSKAALTKPGTYGDKAIALWAATRFTRKMATWNAIMAVAPYALASMIGLDGDDWDKFKKVMPQFFADKLHPMVMPFKDGDGRLTFFDLGKFMPWGPSGGVIKAVGNGDIMKAAKQTGMLQTPFIEAVVAVKTGKDSFTGKDLIGEDATAGEVIGASVKFLWNLYLPSMLAYGYGPAYKTWHAVFREVNPKTGERKSTAIDAAGSWAGTGMRTMNVQKERLREISHLEREVSKARSARTAALNDARANERDMESVVEHHKQKITEAQNRLIEYMKASNYDSSKF